MHSWTARHLHHIVSVARRQQETTKKTTTTHYYHHYDDNSDDNNAADSESFQTQDSSTNAASIDDRREPTDVCYAETPSVRWCHSAGTESWNENNWRVWQLCRLYAAEHSRLRWRVVQFSAGEHTAVLLANITFMCSLSHVSFVCRCVCSPNDMLISTFTCSYCFGAHVSMLECHSVVCLSVCPSGTLVIYSNIRFKILFNHTIELC